MHNLELQLLSHSVDDKLKQADEYSSRSAANHFLFLQIHQKRSSLERETGYETFGRNPRR